MKRKILTVSVLSLLLSSCGLYELPNFSGSRIDPQTSTARVQQETLAPSHWSDVAKIRAEAQRLGTQIRDGRITKVQAAQLLNKYRIALVGHNSIDDAVYEVYQRAAVDSQRGVINSDQSRDYVENALKGWQQRWPNMKIKPANPAFTNFLMEHMKLQPLQ